MALAHAAGRQRHKRILDPCDYLPLRTNMFEEEQGAPWLEHTPDLAHPALWITHRTENECHDHAVELRIREGEDLDRGADQVDGNRSIRQASPGFDQHRLIRLDRLHAHYAGGIIKGE